MYLATFYTSSHSILPHESYLRYHGLKRFHDLGALGLLVIGEAAGDDDHDG